MNELKMSLNQGSCQQSRSRSGSKLVLLPGCDLVFQGVCHIRSAPAFISFARDLLCCERAAGVTRSGGDTPRCKTSKVEKKCSCVTASQ